MVARKSSLTIDLRDERWMGFVSQNPSANIFHHPAWSQLTADCYNYKPNVLIVCSDDGKINAGLPLMQINSRITGLRWVSLPFSDYCTPLYNDDQAFVKLINRLVNFYQDGELPNLELRWEFPSHNAIQQYSNAVLHILDLEPDSDSIYNRLHKMHKRNIKKAQREGVRVERFTTESALDEFYNLHLQTRRRQGIPVQPKKYFDLLGRYLIDQGLGFISLAYKDRDCLAGSVFLHWQQTLTYKYGASNEIGRDLRANHLLMWSAIRWGCENGYRTFDMGKTANENYGLRQFKSMWGAVEHPLIYSTLKTLPPIQKKGRLRDIMEVVIRRSPLWVCRVTGELLYRHYG